MKKILTLIIILAFAASQSAFAAEVNPIILTEDDFSSFSEGDFEFSKVPNIEGAVGGSDRIHIRDLDKSFASDDDSPKGFSYDSSNFSNLDIDSLTGYSLDSDGNLLITMQSERGIGSKLNLGGKGLKGSKIRFKIIYHNHSASGGAEYYLDNSFVRGGGFFDIYKQRGKMGSLQMSSRVVNANNILFDVGYESTNYYNTLVIDMDTITGNATYALWHCTSLDDALSKSDTSGADTINLKTSGSGTSASGSGAALTDIILNNAPSSAGTSTDITVYSISLEKLSSDDSASSRSNNLVMQKGNFESDYTLGSSTTRLSFMAGKQNDDGSYEKCDSEAVFEFDFLWSGDFKSPERIVMRLVGDAGGEEVSDQAINVMEGYFEFNRYTSGQQPVRYVQKVWYKARYTVNLISDTYTFELFNDDGTLKGSATGPLLTKFDTLSELRLSFNTSQMDDIGIEKYFAFDNVKITYNDILPHISKVEYLDLNGSYVQVDSLLPTNVTKLRLHLDAPLYATGEIKDALDITVNGLETDGITEEINNFKYVKSDSYIDIEFKTPLKAGAKYTFSLNDTARTSYGNEIMTEISKTFDVAYNSVDVVSCDFKTGESNETIANLEFINSEDDSSDVVVIAAVYDGDLLKSLNVYDKAIASGTDSFELTASVKIGETLEIYIWDSVQNAKSITEKLFAFSK